MTAQHDFNYFPIAYMSQPKFEMMKWSERHVYGVIFYVFLLKNNIFLSETEYKRRYQYCRYRIDVCKGRKSVSYSSGDEKGERE